MSIIGGGLESSLAQLAQAQQSVAKDKDRERAASESSRRISDSVRLRVAGVEEADAVRGSGRDGHHSEHHEHGAREDNESKSDSPEDGGSPRVGIDLTA
ncbi:MAG TPA: hypothetical protein DCX60_03800 [Phycisphaerales bacterium]|nr:hypothetical protein [Phycisphaerales bacterium]|tara:strand:- start:339 stop:635 length:297 start_codon:yes stop_codon:yes gene_type:complete